MTFSLCNVSIFGMNNAISPFESSIVIHIAQTMIKRFGNNSLAIAKALEMRCAASGQADRVELMREVRRLLSGKHLMDVWA